MCPVTVYQTPKQRQVLGPPSQSANERGRKRSGCYPLMCRERFRSIGIGENNARLSRNENYKALKPIGE